MIIPPCVLQRIFPEDYPKDYPKVAWTSRASQFRSIHQQAEILLFLLLLSWATPSRTYISALLFNVSSVFYPHSFAAFEYPKLSSTTLARSKALPGAVPVLISSGTKIATLELFPHQS